MPRARRKTNASRITILCQSMSEYLSPRGAQRNGRRINAELYSRMHRGGRDCGDQRGRARPISRACDGRLLNGRRTPLGPSSRCSRRERLPPASGAVISSVRDAAANCSSQVYPLRDDKRAKDGDAPRDLSTVHNEAARMRGIALSTAAFVALLVPAETAEAGDGCDKFAWSVARELAWFSAPDKVNVTS